MFNKIFHKYIKRYLNIPNWSNTIQYDGYELTIDGGVADRQQVARDAEYFINNKTYMAVLNNIRVAAENTLRDETYKTEDLYFPKATLFVVGEIYKQMDELSKLKKLDIDTEIKHDNDISSLRF